LRSWFAPGRGTATGGSSREEESTQRRARNKLGRKFLNKKRLGVQPEKKDPAGGALEKDGKAAMYREKKSGKPRKFLPKQWLCRGGWGINTS